MQGPKQRVVLRHAFLKLAYCGPDKAITASDVKRALGTKQVAKLDEAEDAILQAHVLLSKEKVDGACKFFLDMLQQDVAAVVLNKTSTAIRKYETVQDAAHAMVQAVNEKMGCAMVSPWSPAPKAKAKATSASASSRVMPEYHA